MNMRPLEIEEDSLSEKFSELQSNQLVQERLIWRHLTKRKINEMSHIPDQEQADWRDDAALLGAIGAVSPLIVYTITWKAILVSKLVFEQVCGVESSKTQYLTDRSLN